MVLKKRVGLLSGVRDDEEQVNIKIIYHTSDFLIVNKPAGILVHPSSPLKDKAFFALTDWLVDKFPQVKNVGDNPELRPGIVHRLDKDVSGILLIVLNQRAFEYFKNLFRAHQIRKTYLSLVYGKTDFKGVIKKPIAIKKGSIKRTVYLKKTRLIKEAVTLYKRIKFFEHFCEYFSLLKIHPLTGRTHQIRIHLNGIHHPIVGDKLYGKKKNPFGLNRPFLHAFSLEFSFKGAGYKFEADLPQDLQEVLTKLEFKDKI